MENLDKLKGMIETKLEAMGLELCDMKFHRAGRHSSLRVFIDRPEGGVTVAECESASHEISILLDVENFSSLTYALEVSSPGADRPLKGLRDFKKVTGRNVRVIFLAENAKSYTRTGTLARCDESSITLETGKESLTIRMPDILSARTELQF